MICVNKGDVPDLQTALFYSLVHVRSEECPESFHLWRMSVMLYMCLNCLSAPLGSDLRVKKTHTVTPKKSRAAPLSTIRRSISVLRTRMYVFIKEGYYVIFYVNSLWL